MEKHNFVEILQSALLSYDLLTFDEILAANHDFDQKNIKIGIKLCDYLNK